MIYLSNEETEETVMINTEKNNNLELYTGKTFCNWDHVARFMKKYANAKGHRVQICGGNRVNKETNEVIK